MHTISACAGSADLAHDTTATVEGREATLTIERLIPRHKGNWWLIPKDVAEAEDKRRQSEG